MTAWFSMPVGTELPVLKRKNHSISCYAKLILRLQRFLWWTVH